MSSSEHDKLIGLGLTEEEVAEVIAANKQALVEFLTPLEPIDEAGQEQAQGVNDFLDQLVHIRCRQGHTQQTLAEAAGLKQATVSRIESGHANPTLKTLIKIAAALDVKLVLQSVKK